MPTQPGMISRSRACGGGGGGGGYRTQGFNPGCVVLEGRFIIFKGESCRCVKKKSEFRWSPQKKILGQRYLSSSSHQQQKAMPIAHTARSVLALSLMVTNSRVGGDSPLQPARGFRLLSWEHPAILRVCRHVARERADKVCRPLQPSMDASSTSSRSCRRAAGGADSGGAAAGGSGGLGHMLQHTYATAIQQGADGREKGCLPENG